MAVESLSSSAPGPELPGFRPSRDSHEVLEGQVESVLYQDEDKGFAVVRLDTSDGMAETAGNVFSAFKLVAGEVQEGFDRIRKAL